VGDWTNDLCKLVGIADEIGSAATTSNVAFTMPTDLLIHVDGPFGAPAQLVYRETAAIVVGSGIGITPWASVLKDVWYCPLGNGC
jgi:NAD(P)H-flavin reductase